MKNLQNGYFIRNVCLSDLPYLYEICFKTGFCGTSAQDYYFDKNLLGHFYAAPYALFSREFSFVLCNKNGKVCGYILGTDDSLSFYKTRGKNFLSSLEILCKNSESKSEYEENLKSEILTQIDYEPTLEEKEIFEKFPSHLHIDILEEVQGLHFGHELMKVFLENLKEHKVKGVHLGVDGKNIKAQKFYEREGFSILKNKDWGLILSKVL